MPRRILPSITTHSETGHTWRQKIAEAAQLELSEVALFVTGLKNADGRRECFEALREQARNHPLRIPFVHAVSDMHEDEYRLLIEEFGTERFNLHPESEYPLKWHLPRDIRSRIYIENCSLAAGLSAEDIAGFAGLCVDLSHLEDARRSNFAAYCKIVSLCGKYPVGANHISAVLDQPRDFCGGLAMYSQHLAMSASDFNYLCELAPQAFSELCAVELENPLGEQLSFIHLIEISLQRTYQRNAAA